jgi:hypothetical protein
MISRTTLAMSIAFLALAGDTVASQHILPSRHAAEFPALDGPIELPPSSRLDFPGDEGTIEFWAEPAWTGTSPTFRCVVANGRTVHRPAEPGAERYVPVFEARYAVYLSSSAITLQFGDELHQISFGDFLESAPFSGEPTHFAIATKGQRTTIYIDGTSSVILDVGYGKVSGSSVTIGGLPADAKGIVRQRRNQSEFFQYDVTNEKVFGPFRGDLAGVKLWDKRLPASVLKGDVSPGMSVPARILEYGQLHAERDISFGDGILRSDLVAFSRFDDADPFRVELADRLEGNWIDTNHQDDTLVPTPEDLREFEPMTIVDSRRIVTLVPGKGAARPPASYTVYSDGENVGTLLRTERTGDWPLDLLASDGRILPAAQDDSGDRLYVRGELPVLGSSNGGTIELMRPTVRSKGAAAEGRNPFLAELRVENTTFSLKSYDLTQLHPFEFWQGGERYTGSDQWVFDSSYENEMQMAFDANAIAPLGFQVIKRARSGGNLAGTTTTSEREVFNAVRAKFGLQGGSPTAASGGANAEFSQSTSFRRLKTSATTLASSYGISTTLVLDPLFIRLSKAFRDDVEALRARRVPYEDAARLETFIEKWGTHYARAISHGGVLYSQRMLAEEDLAGTSEWSRAIGAFAQYGTSQDPAFKAEVRAEQSERVTQRVAESFERSTWSGAGVATTATNADMIVSEINTKAAVPISMDLRQLHELLGPAYFDDPRVHETLRVELREAIREHLGGTSTPSAEPVVALPSTDSAVLKVKVEGFRADQNDGDGSPNEFVGSVSALAYSRFDDPNPTTGAAAVRDVLATGANSKWRQGQKPTWTTLWANDSEQLWIVDRAAEWTAIAVAPGAQKTYEAGRRNDPHFSGVAELTYAIDGETVHLEDFAVTLMLGELFEQDSNFFDSGDRFPEKELTLRLEDFRALSDGEVDAQRFADAQDRREHEVVLECKNGDTVRFRVTAWAETATRPWQNPSAKAQRALQRALEESNPRTRTRVAHDTVNTPGVASARTLAYFPGDLDGLRRPGARFWTGPELVDDVDMDDLTVVFDLLPGDMHAQVVVDPVERGGGTDSRMISVRHGTFWRLPAPKADELNELQRRMRAEELRSDAGRKERWEAARSAYRKREQELLTEWKAEADTKLGTLSIEVDHTRTGRQELLLERAAALEPDVWYTVGLTLRTAELEWFVLERDTGRRVAGGRTPLPERVTKPATARVIAEHIGFPWPPRDIQVDELYLFSAALSSEEAGHVARAPRSSAPALVRPVAYWPFDGQRPVAEAMLPFQGSIGRVLDDALTLTPEPERLTPPSFSLRDFTAAFDFRTTDSTRSIVLEDELGLVQLKLYESADSQALQVRMGVGGAALAMRLPDYVSTPYVWQRVVLSFDGLQAQLMLDDGSGWTREETGRVSTQIRDDMARVLSQHGHKPIAWKVHATYHYPGTKNASVEGHRPSHTSELALADEVRFWSGAMTGGEAALALRTPRRFAPPTRETRLVGYYPLGRPTGAATVASDSLLEELLHPNRRDVHAMPIQGLPAQRVVDSALLVPTEAPVTLQARGLPLSDFTLHLDFKPGDGAFEAHCGLLRFTCDDGRTGLSIDVGEGAPFRYDPALGNRITTDLWHKLVLAIDAWDSRLQVFLDGESFGRVPLPRPVIEALRAADREPVAWRFAFTPAATAPDGGPPAPALVDEMILLAPALGTFELESLARRQREAGGEGPPTRLRRATGLAALEVASSRLRAADSVLADDVMGYFPLDADFEERSGRGGRPLAMAPSEEQGAATEFEQGGVLVTGDLWTEVPALDLDRYTVAAWVAPRAAGTTLLSLPGITVRVTRRTSEYLDEVARRGLIPIEALEGALTDFQRFRALRQALLAGTDDEYARIDPFERLQIVTMLDFGYVLFGLHNLEVVLESHDGRRHTAMLSTPAAEEDDGPLKGRLFMSRPREDYLPELLDKLQGQVYGPDTWRSLVLTLDVEAGELRGALDGQAIVPIALPRGFTLQSPTGSVERRIGVVGTEAHPVDSRIDELIVLDGAPLSSSLVHEYLATRPRRSE